ncbi:hypothetical protein R1flu_001789 [Riccia fluitans]|uniref:Uncharacterized protein n=1 Tax=Riccia fluitans TaxID=41844 RepID=A0ABD1Y4A1_9MARC
MLNSQNAPAFIGLSSLWHSISTRGEFRDGFHSGPTMAAGLFHDSGGEEKLGFPSLILERIPLAIRGIVLLRLQGY